MITRSPFKFLEAYNLQDSATYFGRKEEEKQLYSQLTNSPITIVYGPSGTGKTSLVQCGLAKYYDGPDWHPFLIRRGNNINNNIQDILLNVLDASFKGKPIDELVFNVFMRYSRPVYLIFDQFEEIFTVESDKNKEEKDLFFQNLSLLLKKNLPCKIIIILREEFLGQLYEYEYLIPKLFDFRLRVEPMNSSKLEQVLDGTFGYYKVKVEPKEVENLIINNLIEGKATSQLAYLQVYLDSLWKTANNENIAKKGPEGEIIITADTINKVGNIGTVLENYLEEQELAIETEFNISQEKVRKILNTFVTDEGTKKPIAEKSQLLNFEDPEVKTVLLELEKARLIAKHKDYYELAHDTLAGILAHQWKEDIKIIKKLVRGIIDDYESFQKDNNNNEWLLSDAKLDKYNLYQKDIDAEFPDQSKNELLTFIETSKNNAECLKIEALKNKEIGNLNNLLIGKNEELEKYHQDIQAKNLRLKNSRYVFIFLCIGLVLAFLTIFNYYQKANKNYNISQYYLEKSKENLEKSKENLKKYEQERASRLLMDADIYFGSGDTQFALEKIQEAYTLSKDSETVEYMKKYNLKME